MSPAWSISEYRGRAGLVRLEADWRRLYAAMPLRTSYHIYDAHLAYVDHLMAAPDELRCLALRDDERVRAIWLLEPKVERFLGPPIRVWRMPFLPLMRLRDIICPEDEARREFIPTLVAHLRREHRNRRLLVLGPLPEASSLWDGLREVARVQYGLGHEEGMHVLDCKRSFDELAAGRSRSFRRDLRRHRARLDRLADVRFVTATHDADLEAEYETLLDVEASGWKGVAGGAIRNRHGWLAFFRSLLALRSSEDYCEINAIYAEGRCIASQLCVRTGREYASLKICYNQEYSRLAPGLLLLEYSLERCCRDPGIARANWLNASAWQEPWNPEMAALQWAYVATGRWSGRPLGALLHFRFGPARRCARFVRSDWDRLNGWIASRKTARPAESPDQDGNRT